MKRRADTHVCKYTIIVYAVCRMRSVPGMYVTIHAEEARHYSVGASRSGREGGAEKRGGWETQGRCLFFVQYRYLFYHQP